MVDPLWRFPEKIREIPKVEFQERIIEVPRIVTQERIVEVGVYLSVCLSVICLLSLVSICASCPAGVSGSSCR